jgi:hypothetical protein
MPFSMSVDGSYSSFRPTHRKRERERVFVDCTTLDTVFARPRRRIDVLKIDVEGAELQVLEGARKVLTDQQLRPKAVLVELNAANQIVYSYGPSEVIAFMRSLGYVPISILPHGLVRGFPHAGAAEDVLFVGDWLESCVPRVTM